MAKAVDPAGVRGRRSNLPGEVCVVFRVSELGKPRGDPTAAQKSADGIVGQAVGKASEALQSRKAEQQIGRAGNDGRRPERWEWQVGLVTHEWNAAEDPVFTGLGTGAQGETPVGGCQGTEPVVAKPAPQSPALVPTSCRCPSLTPSNRRVRDPYARWCGRGGTARCPPIPMCAQHVR